MTTTSTSPPGAGSGRVDGPTAGTDATAARDVEPGAPTGRPAATDRPPRPGATAASRAGSTLATLGHEVTTALLPSLVTTTLGGSPAALGVIEGVADGVASMARLSGGPLSEDAALRRRVSVAGYAGTAVFSAALGLAAASWQAGVLRAGAWTARGLRTPGRYVGVAERTAPGHLGRAYGAERAAEHLGAVGGPLLALALVSAVGVRGAIMLSVVPGGLAVLAILYSGGAVARTGTRERLTLRLRPLLRGRLGWTFAAIGAFECSNLAVTLLILRSTNLLAPHFGRLDATRITLLLYALHRLAATLACRVAGRRTDRRGAGAPLAVGVTVLLFSYAGFAVAPPDVLLLAGCFALAGAALGVVETAEYTLVAQRSPAPLYAASFGLLAALQGLGKLGASTITGVLWVLVAPQAGLLWAAPAVAVCLYCLLRADTAPDLVRSDDERAPAGG